MKRVVRLLTVFSFATLLACNEAKRGNDSDFGYDNDDSKEQAEEANDEKFDDNAVANDAEFVVEAVASNYAEIRLGELASSQSSVTQIKDIGTMLVRDHTKVLDELKTMAQARGFSIPEGPTDDAMEKVEDLREKQGEEFNKDWTKELIDRHEKSINMFEKRMNNTDNAEMKQWISNTLPALRSHLEQLEAIQEQLKNNPS